MIEYKKGDIFNSGCYAFVNPVNTAGVMGKGLALHFKKNFPINYQTYKLACDNQSFQIGQLLYVTENKHLIINFPTKKDWRLKSNYEYIELGLKALRQFLFDAQIDSIAIPAIGCGEGGLLWSKVKLMIEKYLGILECKIVVYEPN